MHKHCWCRQQSPSFHFSAEISAHKRFQALSTAVVTTEGASSHLYTGEEGPVYRALVPSLAHKARQGHPPRPPWQRSISDRLAIGRKHRSAGKRTRKVVTPPHVSYPQTPVDKQSTDTTVPRATVCFHGNKFPPHKPAVQRDSVRIDVHARRAKPNQALSQKVPRPHGKNKTPAAVQTSIGFFLDGPSEIKGGAFVRRGAKKSECGADDRRGHGSANSTRECWWPESTLTLFRRHLRKESSAVARSAVVAKLDHNAVYADLNKPAEKRKGADCAQRVNFRLISSSREPSRRGGPSKVLRRIFLLPTRFILRRRGGRLLGGCSFPQGWGVVAVEAVEKYQKRR